MNILIKIHVQGSQVEVGIIIKLNYTTIVYLPEHLPCFIWLKVRLRSMLRINIKEAEEFLMQIHRVNIRNSHTKGRRENGALRPIGTGLRRLD